MDALKKSVAAEKRRQMSRRAKPLLPDDQVLNSKPARPPDPAQPNLPFDPMPTRVEPCLALLKTAPPKGADWPFEVKWDGYRLAIHIEPKGVRIITRGGHDWTHRFPAIAAAAKNLGLGTAILDGEAVVLDEQSRSDFGALQRSLGGRGGKRSSAESVFFAFDLLYFDGHDLKGAELSIRRHLLEGFLDGAIGAIQLSEEAHGDGTSGACLLSGPRRHYCQAPGPTLSLRPRRRLAEDQMRSEQKLHNHRL